MSVRHRFKTERAAMLRALALARRGSGATKPNPMVGAVIIKHGYLVGEGWHRAAGEAHAEVEALRQAGAEAQGATLFVTLEPCNHYGRTPPCTEQIIQAGVSRVVVATTDENPKVKGGGIARLREAGVRVDVGVLEHQARELNLGWSHWVKTGRPFVLLKLAISLDGKIAHPSGEPRWISSKIARQQVHRLRRHVDAVMVGSGTVIADNPSLTNRTGRGNQPLRVVVDSDLKTSPSSSVLKPLTLGECGPSPIAVIATSSKAQYVNRRNLELAGAEIVVLDGSDEKVDLGATLDMLGKRGVQAVLCEGGAKLATSMLEQNLCNRLMLYQAPKILGVEGIPFFQGLSARSE